MSRLGIVAGAGELPLIAMREALSAGEDPLFFSINESGFDPQIYKERSIPVYVTKVGEIFKLCKKNHIDRLLLLGKVSKDILLKTYRYDLKAIRLLAKMINRNDYSFFQILEEELKKENIEFISQKTYLKSLLLPEGRYTNKKLTNHTVDDICFGMDMAQKFAELDLGQTVVVYDKMVLAVEAIEGTDETIKRGGFLSRKKGAVVCKSSKRNQDDRFDLPTVGLHTLNTMNDVKCKTLAIRSNETIVVNPKEFIQYAEKLKINFVSVGNNPQKLNNKQEK